MHLCKVYRWGNRLSRAAAHGAVDRLNPSSVHVLSPEPVADLTLLCLHCAFCLGHHSWPCEARRCHLSLPAQFSPKAGLRWRLRLCGLMHLSRAIGAVAGRLPGWVGGTVSLPTSLCQAGAGARAHMGITGQGRKVPGPGVWWPGGSWDEGRKTCGQKFGRTGTSLVVRWVRLSAPNAGVGGTQVRSLVRELDPACCNYKVPCAATKIPRAETKTRCSQNKINK